MDTPRIDGRAAARRVLVAWGTDPLPTALAWTAIVAALDAGLAAVLRDFATFKSLGGTWLPFALIFLATWLTGLVMSTRPWPKATHPLPSTLNETRGL